jgi:hypothetical protein
VLIVALLRLSAPAQRLEPLVARTLGVTAFEAAQLLKAPPPVVVLRTVDETRAKAVTEALRPAGVPVLLDRAQVPGLDQMYEFRSFRFEPHALVNVRVPANADLPWSSVTHCIRAFHRVSSVQTEVSRERSFNLQKAVLTQGVLVSSEKVTVKDVETVAREPIIYLMRRDGPAWFSTSARAQYEGLGSKLKPARIENFNTLVAELRARLPQVPYDDRLTKTRALPPDEVDLLVHLIHLEAVS